MIKLIKTAVSSFDMIFDAARKGNNQTSGPDMTPKYNAEEEKER